MSLRLRSKTLLCVLTILSLAGCDVEIRTSDSKNQFTGAGIVFEIPLEDADAASGPDGIRYKSERLSAMTDGKELWVNGTYYGPLAKGDVVDFYQFPEVLVNGVPRNPPASGKSQQQAHQGTTHQDR